jgi:alcohol dehydrogenase class IV
VSGSTPFEFATATRILFGAGKLTEAAPVAATLGKHALVVTGSNPDRAQKLLESLREEGLKSTVHSVAGEPKIADAQAGTECARQNNCDLVIAFGGGSAIDAGKAIAALCTNPGQPLDYLEVIGKGQPLIQSPAPFIAIPTTAGTGAEVTRNAVLSSPEDRVKVSLRHPLMLPKLAIVDPQLTYELPPEITATTGLDALTQLIEPFTCNRANPMTDALCREAIPRAARSLQRACENPTPASREDMALASLHGGLALANSGLGAVHGFAAPIGGMFEAPHGAVCAALLPHVMAANLKALPKENRYIQTARLLTGNPQATAQDAIQWVKNLVQTLKIPGLSAYAITEEDFPAITKKARTASSMKANPVSLDDDQLSGILQAAL